MKVRRFRASDLPVLYETGVTEPAWVLSDGAVLERLPSYTGVIDGKPVVAAGIIQPWQGLAVAWAVISKEALRHPVALFRAVKFGMWRLAARYRVRRMETVIDADSPHAKEFINFAVRLGFQHESVMKRYGHNGETYYKVVWFPPYQFSE